MIESEMVSARHLLPVSSIRKYQSSRDPAHELELFMILISLGLLLLTCVDVSPLRELAVIAWLVSFGLVGLRNTGAALGIYIAAVALYSQQYFRGAFSILERPDHPALLVLLVELSLLRIRSTRLFSLDKLTLMLGVFLCYGLINGFLTSTLSQWSLAGFARSFGIPFVLIMLIVRSEPTGKDLRAFFLVLFFVGGYSAVVSVLQVIDLRNLIFPGWIQDDAVGPRAGGILMHPGNNGRILSQVFCMVYLSYLTWIKGYGRLLLVVLGTLLLAGIFLTYTRGVYLGIVPALAILFWQKTTDRRRTILKRIAAIALVMLGLSLALLATPPMLSNRMGNQSTVAWRLEIWEIGLRMAPQRPLFGYGLQGFGRNAASFYEQSDILTRGGLEATQTSVHNTFLDLVIDFGLIGFLLYGIALYMLFKRAIDSSRMLWGTPGFVFVLAFLIVYLIPGQFSVLQDPAVNLIFYCTAALLGGLTYRSRTVARVLYSKPQFATFAASR